ncbi:MAG: formimidoylglutamase [Bacteroidetes bacterium]|nr:formimidoylglutamase [Bacteroidota bacterium]
MIDLNSLAPTLVPADPALYFSRNDPADPRMGDIIVRDHSRIPDTVRAVLIGVPQDIGVARNRGRVGAAAAPAAVRAMLTRLTPYDMLAARPIPAGFLADAGDIRCDGELEDIHERLREVVRAVRAAGCVPIVVGGGHDITYAAAAGVYDADGASGIINLDAHLDVRPPVPARNSGTSFRMLIDEGMVVPGNVVEFGIQSFANAEVHVRWLNAHGGRIITLDEVRARGFGTSLATAYLIAGSGERHVYATLDMDAVRSADAPGVSATMPDGFSAQEFLGAARLLGRRPATVAMDIAEVNPTYDRDNITAKLAAYAVQQFIAGLCEREGGSI